MNDSIATNSGALPVPEETRPADNMVRAGAAARRRRNLMQQGVFGLFRLAAAVNGLALAVIVFFMGINGAKAINWTFLTQPPMEMMTKGGILPCIVGTVALSLGALLVAFPIGVASAIYLNEYARPGKLLRIIRLGINNLAGVPSVVFGLFGLAFFVIYLKMGVSLLAGALTLGAMSLPVIIGSTRRGPQGGARYLPRGVPGAGSHQAADHFSGGAAGCPAGYPHRGHFGAQSGCRGNSAHHVYRGGLLYPPFAQIHF